jgi:hypothetical protein
MTDVYLEVGSKRVFACAVDWPGWCRSGKSADDALEQLSAYAPRYMPVTVQAAVRFAPSVAGSLKVVEKVRGSATTDFGAPGAIRKADSARLTPAAAARAVNLLEACWSVFDTIMQAAPASLRKGPRGGGRDRDKMIAHVLEAEAMYARKLGVRVAPPAYADEVAVAAERNAIAAALRAARAGEPPMDAGWPPRYAVRRIAWHVLDHAWECEDRS